MRYRRLGKTGYEVSEIGFGTWGIAGTQWGKRDDREAVRALHRAIDLGVNFIDTALVYGNGHSERLIGSVLRERRERIYVATKIPPQNRRWPARPGVPLREVFPLTHIVECTEQSLQNLQTDHIALQQFHVWSDEWVREDEWREAIHLLKKQGKVRAFGISTNDHQPWNGIAALRTGEIDTVQVIYHIFDQTPEEVLFPLCRELEIGVIVRSPLDEGGLTGRITPDVEFEESDWRRHYFSGDRKRQVYERVKALDFVFHDGITTLAEAALRFCLSHPAVSTVIPGMRTSGHVEANCAVSDGRPLSPEDLVKLRAHVWPRNFYPEI